MIKQIFFYQFEEVSSKNVEQMLFPRCSVRVGRQAEVVIQDQLIDLEQCKVKLMLLKKIRYFFGSNKKI